MQQALKKSLFLNSDRLKATKSATLIILRWSIKSNAGKQPHAEMVFIDIEKAKFIDPRGNAVVGLTKEANI